MKKEIEHLQIKYALDKAFKMKLKTLRSFEEKYCKGWNDIENIKEDLWVINEDDSFTKEQKNLIFQEVAHIIGGHLFPDIKAEAIKWVKDFKKDSPVNAIWFIKKFFNLTSEDLK